MTSTKFKFITDNKQSLDKYNYLRPDENKMISVNGGRKKGLEILAKLKKGIFDNYDKDRDYPFLDRTTKLSAYIKFGCVSIREIYYNLPVKHGIIRELFWHDFYANITYEFPRVLQGQVKLIIFHIYLEGRLLKNMMSSNGAKTKNY